MQDLDKNEACDLLRFPDGRKHIDNKWVFKKNLNAKGRVEKYKALLVAKGYSQVEGINFGDIFSPLAKLSSIGFLLSLAITFDLEVEQIDVTLDLGNLQTNAFFSFHRVWVTILV
jgi:hypothetical protein